MRLHIALLFLAVAGAAHAGYVVNGDFSSCSGQTAANWTASTIDGAGGCVAGGFDLNYAPTVLPNVPRIEQTIAGLTMGNTYLISGDYRRYHGGVTGNHFGVEIDGNLWEYYVDETWRSFQVQFTFSGTAAPVLKLTGQRHADVDVLVDNIDITDGEASVPEPSTWLLLGAGLALIAARRR